MWQLSQEEEEMSEDHKIIGYMFDLISVSGGKLASKQLDKPVDMAWEDMDAHLAMWEVLKDAHTLKAEKDGRLVTLLPDGIMMLQISGYIYE
jgi:hypothetical protein